MRFNFVTSYFDSVVPLFHSSISRNDEVVTLYGSIEPLYSQNPQSFFGPIFSSVDSSNFNFFSTSFSFRNTYLLKYSQKRNDSLYFYGSINLYKTRSKSAFFSNAVFYKLSTSSFTSLLFRSNGFKLGGLSANRIFLNQIRFFQFFRNFAFYDLFRRSFNSFFFDRTNVFDNSYSFFLFFKESFFRYFSRYKRINKYSSIFKVSMNQRIKILKNAFMLFFFIENIFQKTLF